METSTYTSRDFFMRSGFCCICQWPCSNGHQAWATDCWAISHYSTTASLHRTFQQLEESSLHSDIQRLRKTFFGQAAAPRSQGYLDQVKEPWSIKNGLNEQFDSRFQYPLHLPLPFTLFCLFLWAKFRSIHDAVSFLPCFHQSPCAFPLLNIEAITINATARKTETVTGQRKAMAWLSYRMQSIIRASTMTVISKVQSAHQACSCSSFFDIHVSFHPHHSMCGACKSQNRQVPRCHVLPMSATLDRSNNNNKTLWFKHPSLTPGCCIVISLHQWKLNARMSQMHRTFCIQGRWHISFLSFVCRPFFSITCDLPSFWSNFWSKVDTATTTTTMSNCCLMRAFRWPVWTVDLVCVVDPRCLTCNGNVDAKNINE